MSTKKDVTYFILGLRELIALLAVVVGLSIEPQKPMTHNTLSYFIMRIMMIVVISDDINNNNRVHLII